MKNRISLLSLMLLAACGGTAEPAPKDFGIGMSDYLQQRGRLCLAKYDWPVDIGQSEFETGSRNALQMPVLQKLGLVSVADASVAATTDQGAERVAVKRYQLTDAGRKYYLSREFTSAAGERKVSRSDICAAKLSLDKIVAVEKLGHDPHPREVSVSYTYAIDTAAPWTADPEFDRVFPMIDRVIRGARQAQLKQTFTRTDRGWVASDLLK